MIEANTGSSRRWSLKAHDAPFVAALLAVLIILPLALWTIWAQASGLTITSGPTVLDVQETSAVIVWTTDAASTTVVKFGTTSALGRTFNKIVPMEETETTEIQHSMTLWELQPATTYYYQAVSVGEGGTSVQSEVKSFSTAGQAPPPQPALEGVSVTNPAAGAQIMGTVLFRATTQGPADSLDFTVAGENSKVIGTYAATKGADGTWTKQDVSLLAGSYRVMAAAKGKDSAGAALIKASASVAFSVKLQPVEEPVEPEEPVVAEPPKTEETPVPPETKPAPEPKPVPPPVKPAPTTEESEASVVPGETVAAPPPETATAGAPSTGGEAPVAALPPMSTELTQALQEFQTAAAAAPTGAAPAGGGAPQPTAVAEPPIDPLCKEAGIGAERCQTWLQVRYADRTCAAAGKLTRESCEQYLKDQNNGVFPGCEGKNDEECRRVKELTTLGYLPAEVREKANAVINQAMTEGVVLAVAGITSVNAAAATDATWWASTATPGTETSPAVVILDSDKDGLPDDFEKTIGTDPNTADTDGDGVNDAEELQRGTDPKSADNEPGKELDPTAKAIVTHQPLQQPRGAGETDVGFSVRLAASTQNGPYSQSVNNLDDNRADGGAGRDGGTATGAGEGTPETRAVRGGFAVSGRSSTLANVGRDGGGGDGSGGAVLSGTCAPNATCLIYVYSYVPMVLTTTADENGNWSYDLGDSVVDGEHTVYVAVTDETGTITKKSNPLSFVVQAAQAVSPSDFLRPDVNVQAVSAVERKQSYYLWGVAGMVAIAAAAAWVVTRRPRRSGKGTA
ncbi:MAG: Ig-like domain-containing protein [Patescibacteria group bacterium]|nr:Ig-like domain-containing protein [Patescibacteria group bacterium]